MLKNVYEEFKSINHNSKVSIAVDPLFTIPINIFVTYQSIYMNRLGLSPEQIGYITSIGLLAQLLNSLYAGVVTNKFGRRRTIFFADLISWPAAFLAWALSGSFLAFLIAVLLNSFVKVAEVAWRCILVDDAPPYERIKVFTFQYIVFVLGNLVVPIGGLLVAAYGMVLGTRIILVFGFISTVVAIITRHIYLNETSIGIEMMKRVNHEDHNSLDDIIDAIRYIIHHKENLILLIIVVLNNFQLVLRNTYYNLYMAEYLKISDRMISIFPAISGIMTLVGFYIILPKLAGNDDKRSLLYGLILTTIGNLIFILTPPRGILVLIISTLLGAIGIAIMGPYLDTCWANSIDDAKRANVISYSTILITAISIPAGAIGGYIYTLNSVMLFVLILGITVLMSLLNYILIRPRWKSNPTKKNELC